MTLKGKLTIAALSATLGYIGAVKIFDKGNNYISLTTSPESRSFALREADYFAGIIPKGWTEYDYNIENGKITIEILQTNFLSSNYTYSVKEKDPKFRKWAPFGEFYKVDMSCEVPKTVYHEPSRLMDLFLRKEGNTEKYCLKRKNYFQRSEEYDEQKEDRRLRAADDIFTDNITKFEQKAWFLPLLEHYTVNISLGK